MSKLYTILLLMLLGSCTTTIEKHTIVRDTLFIIKPPVIIDSGAATQVTDTVIRIIRTTDTDTIIDIRYYPRETKFNWTIQPDTVRFYYRDTTLVTNLVEKVIEFPFWSKVGLALAGLAIGALLILVLWRSRK